MKKKVSLFVSTVLALVLIPAATFAAPAKTDVTGVVTNNGSGVNNAKVTVICNNHAKTDKTDSAGSYLVTFKATDCPAGSHVDVTAKKNQKGGYKSGTANPVTTKLNVALVNVDIPEYGLIGLTGATLLGGGAFMVIRRRQLGGHQA